MSDPSLKRAPRNHVTDGRASTDTHDSGWLSSGPAEVVNKLRSHAELARAELANFWPRFLLENKTVCASVAGMAAALNDIAQGLRHWQSWLALSWHDARSKYRRSFLGPWWIVLGMGITLGMMSALWSLIFGLDWKTYLPHIFAGYLVWAWISGCITGACGLFAGPNVSFVQNVPLPLSLFAFRFVATEFIAFSHQAPLYVIVAIMTSTAPNLYAVVIVPLAALIILFNAFWVTLLLGIVSARFRDIPPLVAAVMGPMLLMTPVLWHPSMLGDNAYLADLNPFTHFLAIVRTPLLGELPDALNWIVVGSISLFGWFFTLAFLGRYRRYVVFWV